VSTQNTSAFDRNYFWIRRLHSLTGVVPIGAFVLVHLFTNAYSWSPKAFNEHVKALNETPLVVFIEYIGIIAPIAFHGILGLWMAVRMDVNQPQYSNFRNWMYFLQRLSGVIVLGFIVFHLIQFRFMSEGAFKETHLPDPLRIIEPDAKPYTHGAYNAYNPYGVIRAGLQSPLVKGVYIVGLLATAFHFANGLWSFCVTWGLTIGRKSQLIMSYVTMAIFLGVAAFGFYAYFGFLLAKDL
jgi:succinate dehydrogenase / fumarate reductase, cytochrome b subunit